MKKKAVRRLKYLNITVFGKLCKNYKQIMSTMIYKQVLKADS